MGVELPQPLPAFGATPEELARWASEATCHAITATWRPGHSEHAPLLVRFETGREIFFETVAEACGPKRFFSSFLAIDGVPMPAYSEPQIRVIVGTLVRMATLSRELDERDFWSDVGATFLRACLTAGNLQTVALDVDDDRGRLALYRSAGRYAGHLGALPEDGLPRVLVAVDRETLLIPRGAFLGFAHRRRRAASPATVNAQMQRLEWEILNLRPRKPSAPEAPRPHLRLWQIANGWDGLHVEIKDGKVVEIAPERGPAVPPGPAEHARDHARSREVGPGATKGPGRDDRAAAP